MGEGTLLLTLTELGPLSVNLPPHPQVEAGSGMGWVEALYGAELLRSLGT